MKTGTVSVKRVEYWVQRLYPGDGWCNYEWAVSIKQLKELIAYRRGDKRYRAVVRTITDRVVRETAKRRAKR